MQQRIQLTVGVEKLLSMRKFIPSHGVRVPTLLTIVFLPIFMTHIHIIERNYCNNRKLIEMFMGSLAGQHVSINWIYSMRKSRRSCQRFNIYVYKLKIPRYVKNIQSARIIGSYLIITELQFFSRGLCFLDNLEVASSGALK